MDRVRELKCRPGRASQRQGKGQLGWAWKARLGHCELPGVGSVTCPITSYTGARVWSFTMQHCCWKLLSFSSPSSNERGSASEYSFRKRETRVHVQVSPCGASHVHIVNSTLARSTRRAPSSTGHPREHPPGCP